MSHARLLTLSRRFQSSKSSPLIDSFHSLCASADSVSQLSTPEKQALLRTVFRESHEKHPTSRDKEQLARIFGFSISHFNKLLRHFRMELGDWEELGEKFTQEGASRTSVSPQLKEQIGFILEKHPKSLPRAEWKRIRVMAREHRLNVMQLYRVMYRLRFPRQSITPEKREHVFQWARENPTEKAPSKDALLDMSQRVGLSEEQIRYLIAQYRDPNQEMTPEKKEKAMQWLQKHDFQTVSPEDIQIAIQQIGLSRQQLRDLAGYIRVKRKPPTDEQRYAVKKMYEQKEGKLSTQDIDQLHRSTRLHKKQIYSLLKRYAMQYVAISEKQKEVLSAWLRENNNRIPTFTEYNELQVQTGMARKQMTDLVRYLRNPPGEITKEKRDCIEAYVQDNRIEQRLTPEQVQHLSTKTGLSVFQVRSISRNIFRQKAKNHAGEH